MGLFYPKPWSFHKPVSSGFLCLFWDWCSLNWLILRQPSSKPQCFLGFPMPSIWWRACMAQHLQGTTVIGQIWVKLVGIGQHLMVKSSQVSFICIAQNYNHTHTHSGPLLPWLNITTTENKKLQLLSELNLKTVIQQYNIFSLISQVKVPCQTHSTTKSCYQCGLKPHAVMILDLH